LITKVTIFVKIPTFIGYIFLLFYFKEMNSVIKRGPNYIIHRNASSPINPPDGLGLNVLKMIDTHLYILNTLSKKNSNSKGLNIRYTPLMNIDIS